MTSPTTAARASSITLSLDLHIDSLLGDSKWGGVTGTGAALAFSFPWTTSSTAIFAGYNGATYSLLNEPQATYHYGLNAVQQSAVRDALAQWSAVANVSFSEVAETTTNVGDLRFAWTSASQPTISGSAAWGWASYPDNYWPSGGDVWISSLSSGAANGPWSAGSANYSSLLHEIGHALGLKHPFEDQPRLPAGWDATKYTVMAYTNADALFVRVTENFNSVSWTSFYVEPDTPMLLDIAAIQYIYGANMSWRTGDDVYTFDPNEPFFRTIWDAGGTDTISVANFSKGCVIDLRDGHYSIVTIESDPTGSYNWSVRPPKPTYDGTPNLAIAFGCLIENAIGGQGADWLIGNDVGNVLNGGGGNDVLDGGAGNDYFDWDIGKRAGADLFYGGLGDDQFFFDSTSDEAVEHANEGFDVIWVGFSYSLAAAANIEGLYSYSASGVTLTGNSLNNTFRGSAANDVIAGDSGTDTMLFTGARAGYTLTRGSGDALTVSGSDGTDSLSSVERLKFADVNVAMDVNGNAGQAYRLYQAAFNRTPDIGGLGYQMNALDTGLALSQVAQNFISSPEFSATYGALNTSQFVTQLYANVLHRAPDSGGLAYHVARLESGVARADVLVGFSESPENQAALIGTIQNGMVYTF